MSLAAGDRIDRYVIEAPIGAGGMGEVYRARDTRLHRTVALKILRHTSTEGGASTDATGPSGGRARMLREARAAAALDHPNVVAIFDVGQLDEPGPLQGTTYLAMELIKGRSLPSFVGDPAIAIQERVRWLVEIARALGAAHDAGLVHRDVKPDNIMIRDDGIVKVLDFGIARRAEGAVIDPGAAGEGGAMSTLTAEGVVIGTPLYMAPEQARGEPLDGRADQFSWAVVAYELLTGSPPWSRFGGNLAVLAQILSSPPPTLAPYPDIPESMKRVIFRALEKARGDRFPNMRELVEAIEGKASSSVSHRSLAPSRAATTTGPNDPTMAALSSDASGERSVREVADTLAVEHVLAGKTGGTTQPTSANLARVDPGAGSSSPARWPLFAMLALLLGAGGIAARWWSTRALKTDGTNAPVVSASAVSAAPSCSPAACSRAHDGAPWVCRPSDHQCVPVASEDCVATFDPADLTRDDTVWIGAMFPVKGRFAEGQGQPAANAVELARREIAESMRMVDDLPAGRGVRRLAIALCDDSKDPMRAGRHLVEDLGAPAVIGFQSPTEVLDVAGHLLLSRGVLTVPTMTGNPLVTRLPQPPDSPRLVWRSTYGLTAVADASARLIPAVLEPLRHSSIDTRVALARFDAPAGFAFGEAFFRALTFNGKSALANGANYSEHIFGSTVTDAELDAVAEKIAAQSPDIVVLVGRSASQTKLIEGTERHWDKRHSARPLYLRADDSVEELLPFAGKDAERRHRIFAVATALDTARGARFVLRYNQSFSPAVTRNENPSTTYDGVYLVDYAILAAGDGAITGSSLARAIPRLLPPGPSIESGPGSLLDAISALSTGKSIDFQGASGDFDFDVSTGEAAFDFDLRCIGVDRSGKADREIESGITLQAKTKAIQGTLKCP